MCVARARARCSEPDHGPQMLYAFSVFMFQGLRFPYSWPICWALYFSYFFANVPTQNYGDFVCVQPTNRSPTTSFRLTQHLLFPHFF
jgi:hypothetical protein